MGMKEAVGVGREPPGLAVRSGARLPLTGDNSAPGVGMGPRAGLRGSWRGQATLARAAENSRGHASRGSSVFRGLEVRGRAQPCLPEGMHLKNQEVSGWRAEPHKGKTIPPMALRTDRQDKPRKGPRSHGGPGPATATGSSTAERDRVRGPSANKTLFTQWAGQKGAFPGVRGGCSYLGKGRATW